MCNYLSPEQLAEEMDLTLHDEGCDTSSLLEAVRRTLQWSVRTSHPLFISKLYHGSDPIGQAAELVTAVLNTNCHTYEVSPVFTLMEKEVWPELK